MLFFDTISPTAVTMALWVELHTLNSILGLETKIKVPIVP
jgi:hypothetical protein